MVTEPVFRYHPDPIATGSAVPERHVCGVCGVQREVRYTGPIYGDQPSSLCLHCIASGRAAQVLGSTNIDIGNGPQDMPAQFSDAVHVPDDVPVAVVDEITQRTPGFTGWQQESWLYHCGDGTAFLGPVGFTDLQAYPDAVDMIRADLYQLGWSASQTTDLLRRLDRTGEPTAYLFRCLRCSRHLASWDIG